MAFQTWQTFEFTMRKPSVLLHLWQTNVMQAHSSRFKLLVLGMWVLLPFNPTMPARQRQHLMILMTWLDSQCSAEAKSKLDIINVGCSLRRIQQVLGSWNMMSTASQWGRVGWSEKVWFPGCERNQPDCSETSNQKIVPDVTSQNMDNMDNQLRKVMFHTSSHSNVGGLFFVFRYEPTKSRPTMVLPVTFHTFLFWLFLWEV